jgi:methylmalonyl-CoA/ethylmalonyl-CoA epimerase
MKPWLNKASQRDFSRHPQHKGEHDHPPMIELLEPTGPDTPIGKFLNKRGPGVQQVCFRVGDLQGLIDHLMSNGVVMIDQKPRLGAGGKSIAFVHPKSTGGVLVELTQSNH